MLNKILVTNIILSLVQKTILYADEVKKVAGFIYILLWTADLEPFSKHNMDLDALINCTHKNCLWTTDEKYFANIEDFDVIMFSAINLHKNMELPAARTPRQIYCMFSLHPATQNVVTKEFDKFFNITFTYKLTSTIPIPFLEVKDEFSRVIGPEIDAVWLNTDNMKEISNHVKAKVQDKRVAVAWMGSKCETSTYALELRRELDSYGHTLDIYGECGNKQCLEEMDECFALLESDYYFYLAIENSTAEDYVAEQLLRALHHYAVPVVAGNTNYSRFMPSSIYIDGNELGPALTAKTINRIINDNKRFYNFFRWHNHYTFHLTNDGKPNREMCALCTFLNTDKKRKRIIKKLADWWNEPTDNTPIAHSQPPSSTTALETINEIEELTSFSESKVVAPSNDVKNDAKTVIGNLFNKVVNLFS